MHLKTVPSETEPLCAVLQRRPASRPRWMRSVALTTTAAFTVSVALALPLRVLAQETQKPAPLPAAPLVFPKPPKARAIAPPASLKENLKPLPPAQAARLLAQNRQARRTLPLTLLD